MGIVGGKWEVELNCLFPHHKFLANKNDVIRRTFANKLCKPAKQTEGDQVKFFDHKLAGTNSNPTSISMKRVKAVYVSVVQLYVSGMGIYMKKL
jgi:hypothetical protein